MAPASALPSPTSPADARAFQAHLEAGNAVVLATDTIPGIGVLAAGEGAPQKLASLKQAPLTRPFSLHLRSTDELRRIVPAPPPGMAAWLNRVLPGPITVVLPTSWLNLDFPSPWKSVGLRLPDSHEYLAWMQHAPGPLWMSSVNQHGEPPLQGPPLQEWLQKNTEVWNGVSSFAPTSRAASAVLEFRPLPVWHRRRDDLQFPTPGLRILCVCTGNTCRSPLAEAILRQTLADAWGVQAVELAQLGWHIESAGTSVFAADTANSHSIKCAAEVGLDLAHHRSQSLSDALHQDWDLVLAMSRSHLHAVPTGIAAVMMDPAGQAVPDPFGQSLSDYRRTRELLTAACQEWAKRWQTWPESGQTYVTASA
ncbi:MAG: Sua5/YciO/YrdC/YwlC family protein [Planctomycetes bacterium]|nr:Sua5/YciO/YrdC/YwlC family protein [Planctomycetota bacterium]